MSSRPSDMSMPLYVPKWWDGVRKQGIDTKHEALPLFRSAGRSMWLEEVRPQETEGRSPV